MTRKEFERITPEQAGICSEDIQWLLDQLESGITEPHGLMIMCMEKFVRKAGGAPMLPESAMASSLIPRPMRRRRLALRIPKAC